MFELLKADQDGGQGDGHWAEYLRLAFHRTTQPPGYTFEDLGEDHCPYADPRRRPRRLLHARGRGHRLPAARRR